MRNWIDRPELSAYFSPGALGKHGGTQRILTESDILVLNTIRTFRSSGTHSWTDIARKLDGGERTQEFASNAISADPRTIPVTQAEQSARAMATVAERDAALVRVDELENKVIELEMKITQAETERDEMKEGLLREIAELNREVGRLQGRLEMHEENRNLQE